MVDTRVEESNDESVNDQQELLEIALMVATLSRPVRRMVKGLIQAAVEVDKENSK